MYDGLPLGEVIRWLETQVEPSAVASPGWDGAHSDRGDYSELAFRPCESSTADEMLRIARQAVGATFVGWKGGEFTMDEHTCCLFGEYGECGAAISSESLFGMFAGPEIARLRAENEALRKSEGDALDRLRSVIGQARDELPPEGDEWARGDEIEAVAELLARAEAAERERDEARDGQFRASRDADRLKGKCEDQFATICNMRMLLRSAHGDGEERDARDEAIRELRALCGEAAQEIRDVECEETPSILAKLDRAAKGEG